MSYSLFDSLTASFREARQNAGTGPLFACIVTFDSAHNTITHATLIRDKIAALRRQYGEAHLAHIVFDGPICALKGQEAVTDQKLSDLACNPTRPQYLRGRAIKAQLAYYKKRTPEFPCLCYTVAKSLPGDYGERLYFGGVSLQTPSLNKYSETAQNQWAKCHAEPFGAPVGIARPDLIIAGEGERPFLRWTALIFRTLFNAGKLQSDSIAQGTQLYWYPADTWQTTLDAIDILKASAMGPQPQVAKGDPQKTIYYHGERSYSVDGQSPIQVTPEQHNFLQAFLDGDAALDTGKLESHGISNVAKVAKKINSQFVGCVRCPEGKKGAGYYVRVRSLTPTG